MGTHTAYQQSADNISSSYKMIDVGNKIETARRAWAQGRFIASSETIQMIRDKKLPKGDALALAEVAGILGAKKTPEILPLCHPLSIDAVRIWTEFDGNSILVNCEVKTTSKTGVEMEALMGVNAALLCLYDLAKMVDTNLELSDIKLKLKEGGKSQKSVQLIGLRSVVVTMSDRCSRGEAEDQSGRILAEEIKTQGAEVLKSILIEDQKSKIVEVLMATLKDDSPDFIVCTGGTGLGPRDVTPEAVFDLAQKMGGKEVTGIGELLRTSGAKYTSHAWLSRSGAYTFGKTLLVFLPGSPRAVEQGLKEVIPLIFHTIKMIHGGQHG